MNVPRRTSVPRRALTLVEVLAVVVILSILATAVAVGVGASLGEAKGRIAITQIGRLKAALDTWKLSKNTYPGSGQLRLLSEDPNTSWYLEPAQLKDPWGRDFIYLAPGPDGLPYELQSYGADGVAGGSGEDADISSARLGAEAGK